MSRMFPAQRTDALGHLLSAGSCKGGLVIHLLVPKCPSAFLVRRLSLADFADLPPQTASSCLIDIARPMCVTAGFSPSAYS